MLHFGVRQLQLGLRHYLLLPKLNAAQMQVFARRLERKGYSVLLTRVLSARSSEGGIHVDPSGLCWSSFDPADAILPAIPDVLASPKERLPLKEMKAMYFNAVRSGGATILRFRLRLESSALWDALRSAGECGLAPDEHAVACFLIGQAGGRCEMLTDFPSDGSVLRVCGRRRYYESRLESALGISTLRVAGERAPRNSYLQRDGTLKLGGTLSLSRKDLGESFESLGEWCYFAPT